MAAERKVAAMDESAIDASAMQRLAKAVAFICGPDHPATLALRTAAETGSESDVKKARAQFLKLKSGDRRAALAMIEE
jgi:Ribonuclease G/E